MRSVLSPASSSGIRLLTAVVLALLLLPLLGATAPAAAQRRPNPSPTETAAETAPEAPPKRQRAARQRAQRTPTPTPAATRAEAPVETTRTAGRRTPTPDVDGAQDGAEPETAAAPTTGPTATAKPKPATVATPTTDGKAPRERLDIDIDDLGVIRGGSRPGVVGKKYIVTFRDDVPDVRGLALRLGGEQGLNVSHVYEYALKGFAATLPPQAVEALKRHPRIKSVTPVRKVRKDAQVVFEGQGLPTGVDRVDADGNATARIDGIDGADGSNQRVDVDVAVLDSGVTTNHRDLTLWARFDCTGTGLNDVDGHGTQVAGIIGALDNGRGVVGVAPGARIWSVKVLDNNGNGDTDWTVCGLNAVARWAVAGGSRFGTVEVANMSLGGPGSDDRNCGNTNDDDVHRVVCRVVALGVTLVAAAGNECEDAANHTPAAYDEVITVAALADSDGQPGEQGDPIFGGCTRDGGQTFVRTGNQPDDSLALYSNFGPDVDIAAPGVRVRTTNRARSYSHFNGTSAAAPHVAGAAALWLDSHPTARPANVRAAILKHSFPRPVFNGWDRVNGGVLRVNTDTTPPIYVRFQGGSQLSPMLSVSETDPFLFVRNGRTLFYQPATTASTSRFTISVEAADNQSRLREASFSLGSFNTVVSTSNALYRIRPSRYTFQATLPLRRHSHPPQNPPRPLVENGVGLTAVSSPYTIVADAGLPTVAVTAPEGPITNGAVLSATAGDNESGVANVQFGYCLAGASCTWTKSGGIVRIGRADTTAPYSVTWTNQPADGTYRLVAVAFDNVSNVAVSAPITVTVANGGGGGATRYDYAGQWGVAGGSGDLNLEGPSGVAVHDDHVYVVDRRNNRVQKFLPNGTRVAPTFGSFGSGDGQLNSPWGLAIDAAGNLYVTEQNNNRVTKFAADGRWLDTWGGPAAGTGNLQFNNPLAVAVDPVRNIVYVADSDNARIQKFSSDGTWLDTLGERGSGPGQFQFPTGVAVDQSGNVYVADGDLNRVLSFGPDGRHRPSWGTSGSGSIPFAGPGGIGVDAAGNIYFADTGNNRIQKFTAAGAFVTAWGSAGSGPGQFNTPDDVAVDGDGTVYVTDSLNNRVQKFVPIP